MAKHKGFIIARGFTAGSKEEPIEFESRFVNIDGGYRIRERIINSLLYEVNK